MNVIMRCLMPVLLPGSALPARTGIPPDDASGAPGDFRWTICGGEKRLAIE
jgi:hypothetical protein